MSTAEETSPEEVELNLSGRMLTDVPSLGALSSLSTVHKLSTVGHLDLSNNSISEISVSLLEFENVTHLDLSKNAIKNLPPFLGRLKQLKSFSVKHNCLGSNSFPEEFSNLSALKSLNLGGNKLETIPDVLTRLPALEDLSLGDNQLTSVSPLLGNLKK